MATHSKVQIYLIYLKIADLFRADLLYFDAGSILFVGLRYRYLLKKKVDHYNLVT